MRSFVIEVTRPVHSSDPDEAPQQHLPTARGNLGTSSGTPLRAGAACGTLVPGEGRTGRTMSTQDGGYDYTRYLKLLVEAVDEKKRLELIDLLIREKARDRLAAQRMSDRVAMTAATVTRILGPGGRRDTF